ncbi:Glycosyl transferase family 2 [Desulfatibacillum alkenivorans DSM 16219]|uniref:Glycosyl transferase family 2 n=1 Tax=Desulfatibacillum alkenivorans DSM 16219 TaxID=1121393 RepID=A0A1M6Y0L9_9BACT|nr:glycosyltransferase [Desulfatibacillum alkenivorans]SHL11653.1 Glycosyl transferase family 2 [Desulfatibacillum alkenivorans DSM 16219]
MNKDAQNQFKASVIIPVFNGQDCIANAIESILEQSGPEVEIVVVNDGSTDGTGDICRSYAEKKQIVYQEQENLGRSRARNAGLKVARGEYIAFLDADDEALPGSLNQRAEALDMHPEVSVVYSNFVVFESPGRPPYHWVRPEDLSFLKSSSNAEHAPVYLIGTDYCKIALENLNLLPSTITAMIRKEVFDLQGGFDESLPFAEDFDLWLRLAARCRFAFIDKPLARYNWNMEQKEKKQANNFLQRLLILQKFKKQCAPSLAPLCSRLIGKTYMDVGLALLRNHRDPKGIGYLAKSLLHPFIYQRVFRSAPALLMEHDPQPLFHDLKRIAHYVQALIRIR